ncbi:unnamed protein product (mitochondrion) [Jaminaea pallidilutea]|uniref:Cytochrome c oxidase subunit 3 n=1 Tax=Jaminaea pallidilutea TaxID=2878321 RepID=A0AB39A6W8_9BASI
MVNQQSNYNVNKHQFQNQPFHLVTPSPWPLLTSFALFNLTTGFVLYFNGYQGILGLSGFSVLNIGFITVVGAIILWFRDVVVEGTFLGDHTYLVQKGITISVGLFILSEVFFFISVFWAFFHSSLSPTVELGSQWPPIGIPTINPFELPLLNTVLLLSSGATVTYAHHSIIQGNRRSLILGTIITLIFAILFTICQGIEYYNAGFTIADGVYGSTFFFSTGFHGIHVLIGTAFIATAFFRLLSYHITDMHHLGFEASILYWHFVDVVWLILFVSVYWWGS